ncbi:MAG: MATE family efflux transporter, partial [Oscillospiraceae bacterium]|nr:MATE family efflux transporter [Oscillospiraceae bacterium]
MPKNFNKDLTQGNVSKQLIKFSIPFLISNLLQASYAITDMIIVGQFCGRDAITGVAIGGQVTILVSAFIIGFGIAGTILVSQYAGAKNFEEQRKTIGTVIILFFILSAILTAVMLFAGKSILILLKTPGSAMDAAYSYQQICMGGLIFIFGYNGICGVLRGMG